jgi:hypothetical protein
LKERAHAQEISVDEYVVEKSSKLRESYAQYLDGLLVDHPDVYVTRYEDMVADVESWLDNLLEYVALSPPANLRKEIIEEALAVQSKDEDATAHNRKGRPGDHREKLQPETIQTLDKTFQPVLKRFGYEHFS